jgi:hypothetical protein
MSILISFQRRFQMWMYVVGHKQLLLRSTKDVINPTRVDVLFANVGAIDLPTAFDGLTIAEAPPEETDRLRLEPGAKNRLVGRKMYLIAGSDFSGYVIAGSATWHEDELEYHEKSHFSTSLELPSSPLYSRLYYVAKIRAAMILHRIRQAISASRTSGNDK